MIEDSLLESAVALSEICYGVSELERAAVRECDGLLVQEWKGRSRHDERSSLVARDWNIVRRR